MFGQQAAQQVVPLQNTTEAWDSVCKKTDRRSCQVSQVEQGSFKREETVVNYHEFLKNWMQVVRYFPSSTLLIDVIIARSKYFSYYPLAHSKT